MKSDDGYQPLRDAMQNASLDDLVKTNIGLAFMVARRFQKTAPAGVSEDDLVSAALMGLVIAADKFDPSKGNRFSTFAVPVITNEVLKFLEQARPHFLPTKTRKQAAAFAAFKSTNNRYPTLKEVNEDPELRPGRTKPMRERRYREILNAAQLLEPRVDVELVSIEDT